MLSVPIDGLEAVQNEKLAPGDLFFLPRDTGSELRMVVNSGGRQLAWVVLSGSSSFQIAENERSARWQAVRLKRRADSLALRFDPDSITNGPPTAGGVLLMHGQGPAIVSVWNDSRATVRAVSLSDFTLIEPDSIAMHMTKWDLGYDERHGWEQIATSPGAPSPYEKLR